MQSTVTEQSELTLRVLGSLELQRGGTDLPLPQSKKTRALLAYLGLTGRPHRRDALGTLLWDVTDDPRGALRWSLSKLRPLLDEPGRPRIVADREKVSLDSWDLTIDYLDLNRRFGSDFVGESTEALLEAADVFRGELLTGLDLPNFGEYQAWCVSMREAATKLEARILSALLERLNADPERAIPYATRLTQIMAFDETAHSKLLRLLVGAGRIEEARQRMTAADQALADAHGSPSLALRATWRSIQGRPLLIERDRDGDSTSARTTNTEDGETRSIPVTATDTAPVGRRAERGRLLDALNDTSATHRARVVGLSGEPGVGKTLLLSELEQALHRRNGTLLRGSAFEVESGRPYGPWIDALRSLPGGAVGNVIESELAPLLADSIGATPNAMTRDRLFGAVSEVISVRAHSAPPVVVIFDDAHWLDRASAELLHYVARMNRHRRLLIALGYDNASLSENASMSRTLSSLRGEILFDEISLGPLTREETGELLKGLAPSSQIEQIYVDSGGNPLYAIELAHADQTTDAEGVPRSIADLVSARIEQLPPNARELLQWAAAMGDSIDISSLQTLTTLPPSELMSALSLLARHGLIRENRGSHEHEASYTFSQRLVRRAIYAALTEPSRRLVHGRIARALFERDQTSGPIAGMIAHHAALGGERGLAARACVNAARRCLRVFANDEVADLARRGLGFAEHLPEPERTTLSIELIEVLFAAGRQDPKTEPEALIQDLAERALDLGALEHARLGYHMLSYLRWESGAWADARRLSLQAEQLSRSADPKAHAVAVAEAARCLTLIERDLGQADALLREAVAIAKRENLASSAIADASGLLHFLNCEFDDAIDRFREARMIARAQGDRPAEFLALVHEINVDIDVERYDEAEALGRELVRLGSRFREGSNAAYASALSSLARYGNGDDEAVAEINASVETLHLVDAKHRLVYALSRVARIDLAWGNQISANARAARALPLATAVRRTGEVAHALAIMEHCAELNGDRELAQRYRAEREALPAQGVLPRMKLLIARLATLGTSTPFSFDKIGCDHGRRAVASKV